MNPIKQRTFFLIAGLAIIFSLTGWFVIDRIEIMQEDLIKENTLKISRSANGEFRNISKAVFGKLSRYQKMRIRQWLVNIVTADDMISKIHIIDPEDKVLFSNDDKEEGKSFSISQGSEWKELDSLRVWNKFISDSMQVIEATIPFAGGEDIESGYLFAQFRRSELLKSFDNLQNVVIIILLALSIVSFIFIIILDRMYKKPLKQFDNALSKLAEEDYTYRVKYKKKDEFTDTFTKLNRTIEKVGYLKEDYKKAEKRIVSLLRAVNDSILVVDTKKNVTSFNDATYKFFKSSKDAFSKWFVKILATNRELNDHLSKVLKGEGRIREKEITVFLPDDTEILARMSIQALQEEEIVQGAVLTFKDLHSINELENNLLRSMKFGVITNLASSISHEIKNPLSAMALHAEILEGQFKKMDIKDKTKVLKSIETLQSESHRLNRIIEQFLTLARPSKLELNLMKLNKIIEDVLELVHQEAQEIGVLIASDLDPNLGIIYGDEDQLKQVLLNLILNAFAATEAGGRVEIVTQSEYDKVIIQVKDTGRGVSDDIHNKIFDLYFTTKKDGGGVGLAVCQNIIKAHDGRIDFESKKGEGTTFTIMLPIKDPTTIRSTRIKPIKKSSKGET
jgi:signal transduction histidine kinase